MFSIKTHKKINVSVTLLFLAVFLSSFSGDKCRILWNGQRSLQQTDFKGRQVHKDAVASTTSEITKTITETRDGLTASVRAYFYCDESWITDDPCPGVMSHEQVHFDITELYARKLRKLLSQKLFADYADAHSKTDSLFKIIDSELDIYQDKYDDETDHSLKTPEQRLWSKKITKQLEELKDYAQTEVPLRIAKKN